MNKYCPKCKAEIIRNDEDERIEFTRVIYSCLNCKWIAEVIEDK
jgi:RNase P subunit RPR2